MIVRYVPTPDTHNVFGKIETEDGEAVAQVYAPGLGRRLIAGLAALDALEAQERLAGARCEVETDPEVA